MEKILYLECYAGISGDMFVAAMLDLGVDKDFLISNLQTLPMEKDSYGIKISRVIKTALDACDFNVILHTDNHDHDMEYLHGDHHHDHEKTHEHGEDKHSHHHEHRNLSQITSIIENSQISDSAKQLAIRIFTILAQAEAKAHGKSIAEVHFHEVGAVDSIVDIVAAAICIDYLQIKKIAVSHLSEGTGYVRCQHGRIPIPVPAVANILSEYKLKLHLTDTAGELITPTGAAIIAAIKTETNLPESFTIEKIGIGAGKRNYDIPNVVRAMIIKS